MTSTTLHCLGNCYKEFNLVFAYHVEYVHQNEYSCGASHTKHYKTSIVLVFNFLFGCEICKAMILSYNKILTHFRIMTKSQNYFFFVHVFGIVKNGKFVLNVSLGKFALSTLINQYAGHTEQKLYLSAIDEMLSYL